MSEEVITALIGIAMVLITVAACVLVCFDIYIGMQSGSAVKIPFKRFLAWYTIAPDNWRICDDRICHESESGTEYIYFGFCGWVRYKLWLRKEESRIKLKKNIEHMGRLIIGVQADVDATAKEAERCAEEAKKILKSVRGGK